MKYNSGRRCSDFAVVKSYIQFHRTLHKLIPTGKLFRFISAIKVYCVAPGAAQGDTPPAPGLLEPPPVHYLSLIPREEDTQPHIMFVDSSTPQ